MHLSSFRFITSIGSTATSTAGLRTKPTTSGREFTSGISLLIFPNCSVIVSRFRVPFPCPVPLFRFRVLFSVSRFSFVPYQVHLTFILNQYNAFWGD